MLPIGILGRFSTTLSALDLATTPFALENAQRRGRLNADVDVPRSLTSLLENYKPYRGSIRALQTYENRTLLPFIRVASKSQSILIRPNGSLVRRRTTPVKDREYHHISLAILRRITGFYNLRRSLEGLDLAGKNSIVELKFNQNYDKLRCDAVFTSRRRRVRRMTQLVFLAVLRFVLRAGPVGIILSFTLGFRSGTSLCRTVNPVPYSCKINANPDVAGIGVHSPLC